MKNEAKAEATAGKPARRPLPDAAEKFPPPAWQAAWIWSGEPTTGDNDYVYFRREFRLATRPRRARLRVAAEREATLWLNGQPLDGAPPVSDPRFKRYTTVEVAARLRPGVNCLAARVRHDCGRGALTAHADARGFLCQLEIDRRTLAATDEHWKTHRCRAWLKPAPVLGDTMHAELFDARLEPAGWQAAGFDDSRWPAAVRVICERHPLWDATQPQARFFPWVNLVPCETAPPERTRHRPRRLVAVGEVLQRREATAADVAVRLSLEQVLPLAKAAVVNATALLDGTGAVGIRNSPPDEPEDTFDGLRNATLILDFGRLMNACFGLALKTSAAVVDIGYATQLEDGRVVPYSSRRVAAADQYIARPGTQEWQTADWRHFRYVQLTFRDLRGTLSLEGAWAEEIRPRLEPRGRFTASDARLERLFDASRRTVLLNITDRTMDNPFRERRQYLGDCSAIVPALTACFGDAALLRRYFSNAAEGQHATGQYRYSYPGHDNDRGSLFDHALSLPLRLWEHYRLFGDPGPASRLWPGLTRFLELAADSVDRQGMMTLPPYNIWFDWGHMDRRGYFLPLQAMTAEAMRRSADLARALGEPGERWAELGERLAARIPRWFDDKRGFFVDAIVGRRQQAHASEHGNSLVAAWDLAPAEMIRSALDRWAENPARFGSASPAWMYLPGAFIHAGRPGLAIGWMHRRLDQLEAQGLDTWPETWCRHGEKTTGAWRCRNSRAPAQGAGLGVPAALLQELCGIQPAAPGFRAVRLVPRPGPLTRLSGCQPGPDGDYALALKKEGATWRLRLDLPSPRHVVLDAAFAPGARRALLDGKPLAAGEEQLLPGGARVGRFRWRAGTRSVLLIDES